MDAATSRAPAWPRVAVVVVVVLVTGVVALPDLPGLSHWVVPYLAGLAVTGAAMACAWWRAAKATGRRRYGWTALGAASAVTAIGEVVRIWFIATGQAPFPSVADAADLLSAPLICAGLCLLPVHASRERRVQGVLDAVATGWALALISWETALGAVVRASSGLDDFAASVAVTYPAMDVVLLVFIVLTLARATPGTPLLPLGVLGVGLVGRAVSDSAFFFVAATGGDPGEVVLVQIGWVLGTGCLAMAPLLDHRDVAAPEPQPAAAPSGGGLLAYVPVAGVLLVVLAMQLNGRVSTLGEELAEHGLVVLLLVRQYLTLRQNSVLAARVAARERELHHLAFHDALTGLANRTLFRDRLVHALDVHRREHRPVGLLFLDLDDFKAVNDTFGHAAGDELLVLVARRLDRETRAGDTAARLGGDEFAVLLESGDDPSRLADRLRAALRGTGVASAPGVVARASIGVVELTRHDATPSADEILARADIAMYTAKRTTKRAPTGTGTAR